MKSGDVGSLRGLAVPRSRDHLEHFNVVRRHSSLSASPDFGILQADASAAAMRAATYNSVVWPTFRLVQLKADGATVFLD